jgi:PST family polysaccharide transporter
LENSARQSYQRIFRSSSIMGAASLVDMVAGVIRTKCAAIFIGVQGVGLLANLTSIQSLIGSFASWGIPMSGMREVALASNSPDTQDVAHKVCAMMRWCWISACVGALLILLLAPILSVWILGDASHVADVRWLALAVLCGRVAAGYTSVLQSLKRVSQLAQMGIVNALGSSVLAAVLYWQLGIKGVALSVTGSFVLQALVGHWFFCQTGVPVVRQSWRQTAKEGWPMIRLGTAFMWNGLLLCLVGFGTNALLTQHGGLVLAGLFNAALSLATLAVNFVLNAMNVDFAPRLSGLGHDKPAMNLLINQQLELGLLISLPLLGLVMVFADPLIHLLFSRAFEASAFLLPWLLLGNLLKIVSWPPAFVVPSLGLGRLFFVVETGFNFGYLASLPLALQHFGVAGAAYAYCLMYLLYALNAWRLAHRHTGCTLAASARGLLIRALLAMLALMLVGWSLPLHWALLAGCVLWLLIAVYCARELVRRIGEENRLVRLLLAVPAIKTLLLPGGSR